MPFPTRTPPYEVDVKSLPGPDPMATFETLYFHDHAPGANSLVVPSGMNIKILSVIANDVATPAVAYSPVLIITNQDGSTIIGEYPSGNVAANKGFRSTWSLGASQSSVVVSTGATISCLAFPDITLRPGHAITIGAYNGIGLKLDIWFYFYQYPAER